MLDLPQVELGSLTLKITKGTTPTTVGGTFANQGVNFVKVESIAEDGLIDESRLAHIDEQSNTLLARSMLEPNDILFTIAGTIGRVALVTERILPANVNQAVAIVRPDCSKVDPLYVYYALRDKARVRQAHARVVQSVQANFSLNELSRLMVPIRPLAEQRTITGVLGALDRKIEVNRKIGASAEAVARTIFKSWFLEFDPVRARIESRDDNVPSELGVLFPDSFDTSELGDIPKGWSIQCVGELANVSRLGISPTEHPEETFAHYSIPAFDTGRLPVLEAGAMIKSNKFFVLPESVLLSRLNPKTPRIWLPQVNKALRSICSTEFAVVCPRATSREWLYCFFSSYEFCRGFATMVTGTSGSHQRVKPESLTAMRVIVPPGSVTDRFTDLVAPILSRATHCLNESNTLAMIHDLLLPRLISGEVRLSDAARFAEQLA